MSGQKKQSVTNVLPALALRNLLRNRLRTFLSGSTIMLVALIVCLLFSLEAGMINDMKNNVINDVTGNIRIRTAAFSENERIQPLQFYIQNTSEIAGQVKNIEGVTDTEQRITAAGSIYRNDKIESAILTGISFQKTRLFSNRSTSFIEGSLVNTVNKPKTTVITKTLADALGLHVGDKFTFFARTAINGSNGATLTVAAIVHLGDTDFNSMRCFLDWHELSEILRMNGNASEILVYTQNKLSNTETAVIVQKIHNLEKNMNTTKLEILPWKETGPIYAFFDLIDAIYFFIAVVFFLLASTVIFNTTMMSVLERRKEIGTLMSLGMNKLNIFSMILLEIVMTAGAAALAGVLLGSVIINFWHTQGFNMYSAGGSAVGGMNLSAWVYPSLDFYRYVMVFITGLCISVLACIFPAVQAMKVEPAETLRTEN